MRPFTLLALLAVPLLTLAQDSSSGGDNDAQVSTILSTSVGVEDGQTTSQIITDVVTLTASADGPQSSNSTSNSNSTNSGNSTSNSTSSSSSSSRSPLPTATSSADGGGNGPGGAPVPGASSNSGIYGPDDGFISSALSLSATTLVSITAGVIGGVCLVWT